MTDEDVEGLNIYIYILLLFITVRNNDGGG